MLKAGFARVDVTPPLGSYISGYYKARYAKGVLDPIELNALAVSDGTVIGLIIISDFIGVDRKYCEIIRRKIMERTGVDGTHIMLSALHQHTSVCIDEMDQYTPNDHIYMESLYRKYCDVAQMALADMKDAELCFDSAETAKPIAFIRRYVMKDGTVATNPFNREHEIDHMYEPADNTVRLLRFKREGANDIAFVNFCTHPDVIGGEYLSADWPGFVRRYVEQDLTDVSCMLLNGVQGDSNHIDFINNNKPKSYEHSSYMGRMIADVVLKLWDRAPSCPVEKLACGMTVVFNKTRTDEEEKYDEAVKFLEDYRADRLQGHVTGADLGRATRITKIRTSPIYQQIPVTVMKLGGFAFVGFGGEPFTHYATAVREACPDVTVISSCLCNGDEGYLPTKNAFAEGGYEANSSPFSPNLEEDCVAAAVKLINELK